MKSCQMRRPELDSDYEGQWGVCMYKCIFVYVYVCVCVCVCVCESVWNGGVELSMAYG